MTIQWPSIKEVAEELSILKDLLRDYREGETEVRLQVSEEFWDVLWGDPSFDQDHSGFWGASIINHRTNVRELAWELLEEAKDSWFQSQG
jgi:hypothetical protein